MAQLRVATLLWMVLCACGDNQDPQSAQALWQQIHEQAYRTWSRAPGYETRRRSNAPHGAEVIIYANELVANTLASVEPVTIWPEGSLIVKEGFDGDDLEFVAVMHKRTQGWFWAEYDGAGDASYSGKPQLCIDCHRSGDDSVRALSLPGD